MSLKNAFGDIALDTTIAWMNRSLNAIEALAILRDNTIGALRVAIVGTPAVSATIASGTVTTVTTAASLTNAVNAGGNALNAAVPNLMNTAAHLANIQQIQVT